MIKTKWLKIYIGYSEFKNRWNAGSLLAGVGVRRPATNMNNQKDDQMSWSIAVMHGRTSK
jgi:hypothetical protein